MSRHRGPVDIPSREDARSRALTMVDQYCDAGTCPVKPVLDRCVTEAVDRCDYPVHHSVALLAFRDVKNAIEPGDLPEAKATSS